METRISYQTFIFLMMIISSFSGCIGDTDTQTTTSTPKYQQGDIVSINSTEKVGFAILKYNTVNDTYLSRTIIQFQNHSWGFYNPDDLPKEYDRKVIEETLPYKCLHLTDLNKIPSFKTAFAVVPVTEMNVRKIISKNIDTNTELKNVEVVGSTVRIQQYIPTFWDEATLFSSSLKADTKLMEILFENPSVEKCNFETSIDLTDEYGNKVNKIVLNITVNRATHEKINYDNFNTDNLWNIADSHWRHPAISRGLGLSNSEIIAEQILNGQQ
ncbi:MULTISPECIES: hypothetical protein [unclassified Methanoregula]|uniref:hypothetical protein n=1 Tax=unclassified Methanoregula TaxID=2649730 RepID=UPI0009D5BF91|nr:MULTISPECIES: hypothetical protein [unclassified Methanoregula]OPX65517.1 MAG: hypothetical protein A4E33_00058 [Methanoregula sp. PtaB.Bin085]OPY35797.1 MAG: hypothetical protein A4E34_00473 [Methanoregula sp. PtaU1.Bin006]